jgi:hypothetical protein
LQRRAWNDCFAHQSDEAMESKEDAREKCREKQIKKIMETNTALQETKRAALAGGPTFSGQN